MNHNLKGCNGNTNENEAIVKRETFMGRVDSTLDFKIFISMKFSSHLIFGLFSNKVMIFFL